VIADDLRRPDPDPGRLMAEYECRHGRLNGDGSPPCGCWGRLEPLPEFMAECPKCGDLYPPDGKCCGGHWLNLGGAT
jgi:hypothetical protein